MPLSPAQLVTFKAAILAETDPLFVQWRTEGSDGLMAEWFNAPLVPAEKSWRSDMSAQELDEASDYAAFDGIVAGKRDAWSLFLMYAPRDLKKNKVRKVVTDVWGASNNNATVAFSIFTAATRDITRAEKLFGGTATSTEGTGNGAVTAKRLSWEARISTQDIYDAMRL